MFIENEFMKVSVNPKGGSLTSIYDKERETELLYQPLPESWQGQDVFIFPFVARLKGGVYTVDGKEYSMKNHGLIRYMTGKEEEKDGDIVISFHSDEETLKQYPFEFEAESHYHLEGKKLTVSYHLKNCSSSVMPYMVGGHPAFKVPGKKGKEEFDISSNRIRFPKKLSLERVTQDDTFSFCTGAAPFMSTEYIDLSKRLFREINTIILLADKFNYVDLIKGDGSILRLHKNNARYLALWSDKYWGDYVAIEPWNGIPDEIEPKSEMKDKLAVSLLKPNAEFTFSYAVEIIK